MLQNQKLSNVMLYDEALTGVHLTDRINIPTKRIINDQGQMIVPCSFARTGKQLYSAKQLGLVGVDPNKIITVYRDEKEVFSKESMESYRSAPITLGHPKDKEGNDIKVTSLNSKELQVGVLEGMPERNEDRLGGIIVLTAQVAIDAIEEGKQELSTGYTCDLELIGGKYQQTNIRANHIAIVARGRAGRHCRISDEDTGLVEEKLLTDEQEKVVLLTDELAVQKQLVVDFKADAEKNELATVSLKASLADAIVAAKEGVIERCETIEQARLIADMRDLADKSITEIKLLVVADQYPEKDFSKKSTAFVDAMFEILVDHAKGETPMSKVLKQQITHVDVSDEASLDKVAIARNNMIKRQTKKTTKT